MATLLHIETNELEFLKAVDKAATGDTIVIGPAPQGIEGANYAPHMLGVLALIGNTLWLNDTRICNTDFAETHGTAYHPFYGGVLIQRRAGSAQEFSWLCPEGPPQAGKPLRIAPAIRIEAEELKTVPLSSGKGIILIEGSPQKRIMLLKQLRIMSKTFQRVSGKMVAAWEGPHALYVGTPTSVMVGQDVQGDAGAQTIQFYRRRGRKLTPVYLYRGDADPPTWATENELFFLHRKEDAIFSAKTGKPVYSGYTSMEGNFFATAGSLAWHGGQIVRVGRTVITDSLVADWSVQHAYGLIYGHSGEIRMLIIK